MNEYLVIGLKTIFFLIIILLIIRIMGKRELGQLNVFDIIVSFMISEIFSNAIADPSSNIFLALLPIFIIFGVQILISFVVLKSKKIRYLIEAKPTLIINNGKINYKEMQKQRYNISDLLQQVRMQGVDDLNEVKFAILESNGTLSVIKKVDSNLLHPYPLINDGKIDETIMNELNLNEAYIRQEISKLGYSNEENVFIAFVNLNNGLIVFPKESSDINKHQNN